MTMLILGEMSITLTQSLIFPTIIYQKKFLTKLKASGSH
jgi:hypothetical protein